jgi:hypothetical protein
MDSTNTTPCSNIACQPTRSITMCDKRLGTSRCSLQDTLPVASDKYNLKLFYIRRLI